MALNTLKVGVLRKLLAGLPDDQDMLIIDDDGCAVEITDIDPMTVVDEATGQQVLTIEFIAEGRYFGFAPKSKSLCDFDFSIDSRD